MSCHRSWDELASLLLREVQVIMVAGTWLTPVPSVAECCRRCYDHPN